MFVRNSATRSARAFGSQVDLIDASDRVMLDVKAKRLASLEADLSTMDLEGFNLTKIDLNNFKNKWSLSARIDGNSITRKDAFELVREEIRAECEFLRGFPISNGNAVGVISRDSVAVGLSSSAARNRQLIAFAAACAGCLGLVCWRISAPPLSSVSITPSAAPSVALAAQGTDTGMAVSLVGSSVVTASRTSDQATTCPAGTDAQKQKEELRSPASSEKQVANISTNVRTSSLVSTSDRWPRDTVFSLAFGAAGVVIFAGLWWWITRPRNGNDNCSASISNNESERMSTPAADDRGSTMVTTQVETLSTAISSKPSAPAIARAEVVRAQEVVYENQPDSQQTWDMAASVRGISGTVQDRVKSLEQK